MTCIFEDTFLFSSRFLSLSLHFLTSLEIPIHLFGVWLIYTKTPKTMNSAKSSIMQLHIACSIMDFYLSFLLVFYIWMPALAGIPVGLLSYFGVSSPIQLYGLQIIMIAVSLFAVAFFENRYDVLVIGQAGRSDTRNMKRVAYFFLNFLVSASAISYLWWNMMDPEVSRRRIQNYEPCIPISLINHPMYVNLSSGNKLSPYIIVTIITAITLQGAYFFFYTLIYLFFSVRTVSKSTQVMQKKFFFAMTLQAFIPTVAFFAPLFYYYMTFLFEYYNQKYNNFAMITMGFNGLLTTIVMILVHAPYRAAVSEMLGVMKGKVSTGSRIFTKNRSRAINLASFHWKTNFTEPNEV